MRWSVVSSLPLSVVSRKVKAYDQASNESASSDLSYRYEEYSDWTSGFVGALILKNNSSSTIRDWTITFNSKLINSGKLYV